MKRRIDYQYLQEFAKTHTLDEIAAEANITPGYARLIVYIRRWEFKHKERGSFQITDELREFARTRTAREVADHLGLEVTTVRQRLKKHKVEFQKFIGKKRYSLKEMVNELQQQFTNEQLIAVIGKERLERILSS